MSEYLQIAREIMRERQRTTPLTVSEPLETTIKGHALELWSDALGHRLWLVADEDDASVLGEPRGQVYTAEEARKVVRISDPSVVAEVCRWKRMFNATVLACTARTPAAGCGPAQKSDKTPSP
ncbi:MAG: hypothetical protein ABIZ80_13125 [Bryobacteraceae bacterium]